MEKLVREELERWDSESSIGQASGRGVSPGGSSGGHGGMRARSRPSSGQNVSTATLSSFLIIRHYLVN